VASPGEIVLLSPAATSFGLFKHEFDRGKKYLAALEKIKRAKE
jgi:UDP-N-acetylmuramoylalanine-D-glutamate ligase